MSGGIGLGGVDEDRLVDIQLFEIYFFPVGIFDDTVDGDIILFACAESQQNEGTIVYFFHH